MADFYNFVLAKSSGRAFETHTFESRAFNIQYSCILIHSPSAYWHYKECQVKKHLVLWYTDASTAANDENRIP
jgi:hypothetical protein